MIGNHPIWTKQQGWTGWAAPDPLEDGLYKQKAEKKMLLGAELALADGSWEKLESLGYSQAPEQKVYTLKTDGTHSFTANGYVVHNNKGNAGDGSPL